MKKIALFALVSMLAMPAALADEVEDLQHPVAEPSAEAGETAEPDRSLMPRFGPDWPPTSEALAEGSGGNKSDGGKKGWWKTSSTTTKVWTIVGVVVGGAIIVAAL